MRKSTLALLATTWVIGIVWITGCVVDDADRCLDDAVWNEAERACIPKPEVVDTGADTLGDTDPIPVDTNADDTDTDGLGLSCDGDTDCATFSASYCLKDPTAPNDPGICSIPNCTPADCGTDYTCCDCTASALVPWPTPVCAPSSDAGTLGMVGCTCEGGSK